MAFVGACDILTHEGLILGW